MKNLKLNNPDKRRKKRTTLVIVALVCFVFLLSFFSGRIFNLFYQVSFPIQNSLGSLGNRTSFFVNYFLKADQIRKEKEILENERQQLIAEIFSLKEIERENQFLREALELGLDEEFNLVFAQAFSFDFPSDSFLVDKGKREGVSIGMPVITSRKIVVGRVFEVYDNFSRIMLITHKDSSFFDARIQKSETIGVVKGESRFSLILDFIDKDDEIEVGRGVITMGEIFPGGFLAGKVKKVTEIDAEPFQKVEIKPLFDPRKLEKVFIITNY